MDWTQIIVAFIGMLGVAITSIMTNKGQSEKSTKELKEFITKSDSEIKASLNTTNQKVLSLEEQFNIHIKQNEDEKYDSCRTRILRFDDELRLKQQHSEEHFIDILHSIDLYQKYCMKNPDYSNNRCNMAISHIKSIYEDLLDTNGFLK